ncbi:hypothetical protein ACTOB_008058 [Actinoplanes oblitus]|uniref:Skin secretory protein xP2-like n=1 Tax=Actinoplanes oblitus TaxID=3040509 RepID=A0ABY8WEI5_9ACTN|nr:hypothetical protein [Actinoplanes oblitus]WIM95917.1 hypothetical protein ACTOB_008058 [Actinoplanes oblitus]
MGVGKKSDPEGTAVAGDKPGAEGKAEGDPAAEGEPAPEGDPAAEGEPAPEGDPAAEGEPAPEGDPAAEGEPVADGEAGCGSAAKGAEGEAGCGSAAAGAEDESAVEDGTVDEAGEPDEPEGLKAPDESPAAKPAATGESPDGGNNPAVISAASTSPSRARANASAPRYIPLTCSAAFANPCVPFAKLYMFC